jgi:hypothetical protein
MQKQAGSQAFRSRTVDMAQNRPSGSASQFNAPTALLLQKNQSFAFAPSATPAGAMTTSRLSAPQTESAQSIRRIANGF